jgi:hypothetical protein
MTFQILEKCSLTVYAPRSESKGRDRAPTKSLMVMVRILWGAGEHPPQKAVPNGHINLFFGLRPAT